MTDLGRMLSTGCLLALPMLLGGCFGAPDRTVAGPVDVQATASSADAKPPLKTVGRRSRQMADADDTSARVAGLPTPAQIFDFHPAGAKPGSWRAPFVIDPNDGPLAGYVRHMDAELKASDRELSASTQPPTRKKVCASTGPAGAIAANCGENGVADRMK